MKYGHCEDELIKHLPVLSFKCDPYDQSINGSHQFFLILTSALVLRTFKLSRGRLPEEKNVLSSGHGSMPAVNLLFSYRFYIPYWQHPGLTRLTPLHIRHRGLAYAWPLTCICVIIATAAE